ncbi:MAG: putative ABC-type nitrate/sulfonate transport system, permease component [Citricoccus sp.]|jgi:sulfonate transport system permease protein|nr:putative ABC-type nitrate/sulfonate transport system, permease component [Citricoccus sp. WCRC_4]
MTTTADITATPVATPRRPRRRSRRIPSWVKWALAVGTPTLLLAAWWTASADSSNTFFPSLEQILTRFQQLWLFDHFLTDVVPSLANLAGGFALAAIVGVGLGFVLALIRPVRWLLEPIIHFVRSIPPVALVPIFITMIGFGNDMRITSIALAATFPTLIATMDGIRSVDGTLKDVSVVYRLTRAEKFTQVYLPAAAPQIFAGLQVSLQVAFIVMIASEMLGAATGIGALTLTAQQSFMIADMWAGVLLLGVLGFVINKIFDLVKARILAWYFGAKEAQRAT